MSERRFNVKQKHLAAIQSKMDGAGKVTLRDLEAIFNAPDEEAEDAAYSAYAAACNISRVVPDVTPEAREAARQFAAQEQTRRAELAEREQREQEAADELWPQYAARMGLTP